MSIESFSLFIGIIQSFTDIKVINPASSFTLIISLNKFITQWPCWWRHIQDFSARLQCIASRRVGGGNELITTPETTSTSDCCRTAARRRRRRGVSRLGLIGSARSVFPGFNYLLQSHFRRISAQREAAALSRKQVLEGDYVRGLFLSASSRRQSGAGAERWNAAVVGWPASWAPLCVI